MPERLRGVLDLEGRRLLIVEEALKDFVGHWYEYVRSVADLNRAAGVGVTVVTHAAATPALRDELDAQPLFDRTIWDGDYRRGSWLARKLGLPRHNWLVFSAMRRFVRAHGPFDCVFAPTVVMHHVFGWRLLFALERKQIGRMVLLVRNNVAQYHPGSPDPHFGASARLFGWGLRSLAGHIAAGRVVFATDSARLAEEYRQLCGIAPVVFPSPRVAKAVAKAVAAPVAASRLHDHATPLLFACLGPARLEKGIDVLQAAIAQYLADPANPPARFAVQWPSPIDDEHGQPYLPDAALAASGKVDFITDPLDSEAYDALVAATDCMVLPYRRSSYFARISGVAVEAVTGAIPVIATADTWTSELVASDGAGLAVPDGDAPALAKAMVELARDYPRYREMAAARQQQALDANSGAAFLECLWAPAT
jgi:glycosyltransferase involved in cell wall biosynthesis